MKQLCCLYMLLLCGLVCKAQLMESFDDGEFDSNPSWTATPSAWTVNASFQLQSAGTVANSGFYIATASSLAVGVVWDFYIRLAFNTSSNNYADVFLTASTANLSLPDLSGYFVRIGNTQDEVSLYRRDAGGLNTKLIDGMDGRTNTPDNEFHIRVLRDSGKQFKLYIKGAASGSSYQLEGNAVDSTYLTGSFFGIYIRQSTASFFGKHYFDTIGIAPYVPDLDPPELLLAKATSDSTLVLLFSEPLDAGTTGDVMAYEVLPAIHPVQAGADAADAARVLLRFAWHFPSGNDHILHITGIKDLSGNMLSAGTAVFSYYRPLRFDVVIDEVQADPSPPVGLPPAEFVELKNRSSRTINLAGWRISTTSTSSEGFPDILLPPDSFLILTNPAAAMLFTGFGKVLGVPGFPALANRTDTLALVSPDHRTIHGMAYSDNWHRNSVKKNGGWSLEMIDASQPCTGAQNWTSSTDPSGGTPGRVNSVAGTNDLMAAPRLLNTYSIDSETIVARFSEGLDSITMADISYFKLNDQPIAFATPLPPLFHDIRIGLTNPLETGVVYTLNISVAKDCAGQFLPVPLKVKAGLPEPAAGKDVVINEILFNPRAGSYDFVEVFNRSNKIIDVSRISIARRASMQLEGIVPFSVVPWYLFPGDYVVVNEEAATLKKDYFVANPDGVLGLPSFPSLPDDTGNVVLCNKGGDVIDELSYSEKWHFALITHSEGISLERIDPDGPAQERQNWHSAASTAGYATPTYRNSQYGKGNSGEPGFMLQPHQFSPDNDGVDDVAMLSYTLEQSGYVANIRIFNADGLLVRYLVKNELLGRSGKWNWEGLDEKRAMLFPGIYIFHIELFNLDGKKETFRKTVVLLRKLL